MVGIGKDGVGDEIYGGEFSHAGGKAETLRSPAAVQYKFIAGGVGRWREFRDEGHTCNAEFLVCGGVAGMFLW